MREIEQKLEVDDDFNVSDLAQAGYELDELPQLNLSATYYDTPDLRLAKWGATLRFRKGEEAGDVWTLKLEADEGREELNFDSPAGQIPKDARAIVTAIVRGAELRPFATLRTKRRRWAVRDQEAEPKLAEVAYDEVAVVKSRRVVQRFREVEVEAIETDGVGIARIANVLRKHGAGDSDQLPKAFRAFGDAGIGNPEVEPLDKVKPRDSAKDAIRAALSAHVIRLMKNDPLTRLGHAEGLHQMRVACRRTRSDLKTFGDLVDSNWVDDLTHDLKWTGDVLGKVRDLDVMIDRLHDAAKDLDGELGPLFEALAERQQSARKAATTALRSKRYVEMVERLIEAARDPMTTDEADRPSEEALVPLVASRWRKLAGAAQAAGSDTSNEVLHDIRIKAKKTRYAAEAVALAVGKNQRKELLAFADKVAGLQDVLGGHQDATVAMDVLRDTAKAMKSDTDFVFAAGQLFEREAGDAKTARKELKTTWAKIDRKKNLGWLTT